MARRTRQPSAASAIVDHFASHGAPDDDDLLTLGWHGPWRRLAQNYSGTGSQALYRQAGYRTPEAALNDYRAHRAG